jgi:ankyrin repeat protein
LGAKVSALNNCEATALHGLLRAAYKPAEERSRLAILKCLIKRETAAGEQIVNKRDVSGSLPLHTAACNGHASCIRYLTSLEGFDINCRTNDNTTPLFLACCGLPGTLKVVHALLKVEGIDTNQGTKRDAFKPLQVAVYKGDAGLISWFIRKGAEVNACDIEGQTALHNVFKTAAGDIPEDEGRRLSVVKCLLRHGADITAVTDIGQTPLMVAAMQGQVAASRLLVARDPSCLNMKANDGATALMLACMKGCVECVRVLLDLGAGMNIAAVKKEMVGTELQCGPDEYPCLPRSEGSAGSPGVLPAAAAARETGGVGHSFPG